MLNDPKVLSEAINQVMPFGKYAGRKLIHLPEPYLVWFNSKGFPEGKLGRQLALIYEIKLNGLEKMLAPLVKTGGFENKSYH
ncbi:hypothetical protein CXF72_12930 [Psychromonas sp. MB-3u-54]|nr:hypothetical protein CXF72_12930 [Psychromonas sp. MB-3u-54]